MRNFLFFWGTYQWVSNIFLINGDFCIFQLHLNKKDFKTHYFHKLHIGNLELGLFQWKGQCCCYYSIKYAQLSYHSCFLTHSLIVQCCQYYVTQKCCLYFYLIWIQCHYVVYCPLVPVFWNKLIQVSSRHFLLTRCPCSPLSLMQEFCVCHFFMWLRG